MNSTADKHIIRPCVVNLTRCNFSKIRIACTANVVETGEKLVCSLKQEQMNTFSIKIKRFHNENNVQASQPNKKQKVSNVLLPTEQPKGI